MYFPIGYVKISKSEFSCSFFMEPCVLSCFALSLRVVSSVWHYDYITGEEGAGL